MQHFGPHAIDNRECNLRPVLRRIDVDAERTFAEWRVHDSPEFDFVRLTI